VSDPAATGPDGEEAALASTATPASATDVDLRRLRRVSHLSDDVFRVPGTRFRIGIEPLLGLLPVGGDAAGAAIAGYVLWIAVRADVPRATLARIAFVLLVDVAVGTIPIAGDVFDAYWKASRRSVRLLDARLVDPGSAVDDRRYLRRVGLLALAVLVVVAIGAAVLAAVLARRIG
jgi:hypothetical protein